MTIQHTTFQGPKSQFPALFGFAVVLLRGNPLDEAAAHSVPSYLRSDRRGFQVCPVYHPGVLPSSRKLHFGSPAAFPIRPNTAVIPATAAFHLRSGLTGT